jgi:hypothetical protein
MQNDLVFNNTDCSQAHDHNEAQGNNLAGAGSVQGVAGLSNNLGPGQCVDINPRNEGGQPPGLCIEIDQGQNGGQSGGQNRGQKGAQKGAQNGGQNGGNMGDHSGGQNDGQRGQQGGLGAAGGNAHTTLTEILTLGGTGSGYVNTSSLRDYS